MKLKTVNLADLVEAPFNYNGHPQHQIEEIAKSLDRFAQYKNIVVWQGKVIAGNGLVAAARHRGWKTLDVEVRDDLSESEARAMCATDNALPFLAEPDPEELKALLEGIEEPFDVPGINADWLESMGCDLLEPELDPEPGDGTEDEIPEEAEPVCKLGDLWQLGEHKLYCGDCTDAKNVDRLMDGEKADMVFTSPPYNANTVRNIEGEGRTLYLNKQADDRTTDEYLQFNRDIFESILSVGAENLVVCYNINYNKKSPSEYIDIIADAKKLIPLVETIAWEKTMAITLHGDNLTRIYEFIFVFSRTTLKINKEQNDCVKNLWKINNVGANSKQHNACFPVELPLQGINLFSKKHAIVYEPFGGSGTTMIACEKTGRRCMMCEIDEKYCDIIIQRWEDYTGKKAVKL